MRTGNRGRKMVKLALIGIDVSKSASPKIHSFIARELGKDITYECISIPKPQFVNQIDDILNKYDGLNVTIPYKLSVMSKLKEIVGDALSFGAVNTVCCATRTGYNTDGAGFMKMLSSCGIDVNGKTALVLGAGGAGRSCVKKLLDEGATVEVYNRTYEKALALKDEFNGVKAIKNLSAKERYLIVNATGVGMHESVGLSPVTEDVISCCESAVDLIYEPKESEFLRIARGYGKKTVNGLSMLFYQAYYADCIFFKTEPNETQATALYNKFEKEIIL